MRLRNLFSIGLFLSALATSGAWAASPAPQPLVLASDPFDVAPALDRDNDCLDDAAEAAIAGQFRPYFVLDSRENAFRPGEPVVLFQVSTRHHRGDCAGIRQLRVRYSYLFADDGGYATSFFCGDRHHGDNQTLDVLVDVDPTHRIFSAAAVNSGAYSWPRDPMRFHQGQYPVAFLSAGKHHAYVDTSYDGRGARYSSWSCREGMNARGPRILSLLTSPRAPGEDLNVGESDAHPADRFVNDLTALGYRGEHAWSTRPFCGGHGRDCTDEVSSMGSVWR